MKKLAKTIGTSRSMREAMLKADYAPEYANNPQRIARTKGFKTVMEQYNSRIEAQESRLLTHAESVSIEELPFTEAIQNLERIARIKQTNAGNVNVAQTNVQINIVQPSSEPQNSPQNDAKE